MLFWDVYELWRALGWWWSLGFRQVDFSGDVPLNGRYQQIFGDYYGFGCVGLFVPLIDSRKCVDLGVLRTGTVRDSEVEASEKEHPPGLTWI